MNALVGFGDATQPRGVPKGWDLLRHPATAGLIKRVRAIAADALEAGSCG